MQEVFCESVFSKMIYRKNGINGRPFIRAALSNKEQFLLSKFWAQFSKKLIRAAAINSVYTVCLLEASIL